MDIEFSKKMKKIDNLKEVEKDLLDIFIIGGDSSESDQLEFDWTIDQFQERQMLI